MKASTSTPTSCKHWLWRGQKLSRSCCISRYGKCGYRRPQPGSTPQELFRTQYRGRRYSFGYPACPRLEDQEQLFRLLDITANIGVELTEGFMMDPEGSVSALVFHHPDAKYFNLSEQDIERLEREVAALNL